MKGPLVQCNDASPSAEERVASVTTVMKDLPAANTSSVNVTGQHETKSNHEATPTVASKKEQQQQQQQTETPSPACPEPGPRGTVNNLPKITAEEDPAFVDGNGSIQAQTTGSGAAAGRAESPSSQHPATGAPEHMMKIDGDPNGTRYPLAAPSTHQARLRWTDPMTVHDHPDWSRSQSAKSQASQQEVQKGTQRIEAPEAAQTGMRTGQSPPLPQSREPADAAGAQLDQQGQPSWPSPTPQCNQLEQPQRQPHAQPHVQRSLLSTSTPFPPPASGPVASQSHSSTLSVGSVGSQTPLQPQTPAAPIAQTLPAAHAQPGPVSSHTHPQHPQHPPPSSCQINDPQPAPAPPSSTPQSYPPAYPQSHPYPPQHTHLSTTPSAPPLPAIHHQPPQQPYHYQHPPPSQPHTPLPPSSPPRGPITKPIIMDPPSVRKAQQVQQAQAQQSPQPQAVGFPSPSLDHARINPKFIDDCTRLTYAVQQSLPEAVRRIVRDHWEKCLIGSDFHQAFILNASIHHAAPSIAQRAVRDFGRKLVSEAKHEFIGHFTAEDLDDVADLIISKASDKFLDKCLEKRLLTIEAKPLINALAKAERLGYDSSDIIQDDQHERVIPKEAFPGASTKPAPYPAQPSQAMPYPAAEQRMQCLKCFRTFIYSSAYDYHMRYNVCSQIPPTANGFEYSCPHCGQGFTNVVDLQFHGNNRACGVDQAPTKVHRGPGRPPKSAELTPQSSSTGVLSFQTLVTNGQAATPSHTAAVKRATATTPNSPSNPYAHLTEEQLHAMNEELRRAEEQFAHRFAEAEKIPDERARKAKIEGLRNSFGTKQSIIRKKYGVRLRERRTKAEIMAERERMGLLKQEKERNKAQTASPTPSTIGASSQSAVNTARAAAAVWEEHEAKRRRLDGAGGYRTPYKPVPPVANDSTPTDNTPTARKSLTIAEIGGSLSRTAATAASHDPILPDPVSHPPSTRVYKQADARIEVPEPVASTPNKQAIFKPDPPFPTSVTLSGDEDGKDVSKVDASAAADKRNDTQNGNGVLPHHQHNRALNKSVTGAQQHDLRDHDGDISMGETVQGTSTVAAAAEPSDSATDGGDESSDDDDDDDGDIPATLPAKKPVVGANGGILQK